MLNIIILLLLIGGFFIGLRRGLVLQVVHLVGFFAAYIIAFLYCGKLAHMLTFIPYPGSSSAHSFFDFQTIYYRTIAFILIFIAVKVVMGVIGHILSFIVDLPLLRTVNGWLGGALGFVEIYLVLFILLYIGTITPVYGISNAVNHSYVASLMMENTPILSSKLHDMLAGFGHHPDSF
ncbi:putative membrane protein required for colicin V production [Scopulibacillus daqui]|uniref:Membrane protein required for colicin V production n=1 Tax=Scopulibacillus daqui TaxID=1469162 RepID=A0ABS2PY27_9BACL|nr:CvpA family protein [Scopulibacillus daqui]MBM7644766.1 putative membrane protein required for colicin V production [Scopulibacillus daqui]